MQWINPKAFSTPAGAADLIASRIPPGHIDFLLGCWVVVLLSSYCKPPTTPTRPTTPIRPTNHKHQKTKRKDKKAKKAKNNKKTKENRQIDPTLAQEGSRMEPKWSQNGKKGVQLHKMVPGWRPGPIPYEGLVDFWQFLGPLWNPKIAPKRDLGRKWSHQNRLFIDFCAFSVSFVFLLQF